MEEKKNNSKSTHKAQKTSHMTAAEVQIVGSKCREYTGKVVKLKFNNFDDGMQNLELPSVIKVYYYST